MVPVTDAVNCFEAPPLATVSVEGVTATLVIVGFSADTVTVAVPNLDVSASEVAFTVKVPGVASSPMVKRPVGFMEVPFPPPVTVHVTAVLVWVPVTVAVNC